MIIQVSFPWEISIMPQCRAGTLKDFTHLFPVEKKSEDNFQGWCQKDLKLNFGIFNEKNLRVPLSFGRGFFGLFGLAKT